jgi:hypothetical protein
MCYSELLLIYFHLALEENARENRGDMYRM